MNVLEGKRLFLAHFSAFCLRRVCPKPHFLWLGCLLCVLCWPVSQAQAGACCLGAALGNVGRLKAWEHFSVGVRSSVLHGLGRWNSEGQWQAYDGYGETELREELWALVKLHQRVAIYARLPWSINRRVVGEEAHWGNGLADTSAGVQVQAITQGQFGAFPALVLLFSVNAPTGRTTANARDPWGSDVTGRGAWSAQAGLQLEKVFYPWFVRLDFGVQHPFSQYRADLKSTQRFGTSLQSTLFAGLELSQRWVLSAALQALWEGQLTLDGVLQEGSQQRWVTASLALAWQFHTHWTLQTTLSSSLAFSHFGHNTPGLVSIGVGLRYGHF